MSRTEACRDKTAHTPRDKIEQNVILSGNQDSLTKFYKCTPCGWDSLCKIEHKDHPKLNLNFDLFFISSYSGQREGLLSEASLEEVVSSAFQLFKNINISYICVGQTLIAIKYKHIRTKSIFYFQVIIA